MQAGVDDLGKRQRTDVGNILSHTGDDELPAGGNGVAFCVLTVVAKADKAGDDHIVIAVLGEAQTQLGQLRGLNENLLGGIFVHTEVDLGVDHQIVAAGQQTQTAEGVEAAAAAQHKALTVVALLHTGVQVAVTVEREEEIL